MVPLAPPLKAVLEIRLGIEQGLSVAESIRFFSKRNLKDLFARELGHWLFKKETGQVWQSKLFKNSYRKYFINLLTRGLKGEPILERLQILEKDLTIAAEEDLERHLQKLPFISLIPLMLFEFPAFILLLLGPLILDLLSLLENS